VINGTEKRSRLSDVLLAGGVGIFCAWAVFQSFVNHSGWLLAPWLVVATILGCIACPIAIALTGVPQRLARQAAEFWGGGAGTRAIGAGGCYGCVSIAWGIALVAMFGVGPAGR